MCLQAFPGHRSTVSSLCFRYGTAEVYSGSFDRTVKVWNVEDKAFVDEAFGQQAEILTVDVLRKERALVVGRDRTMQLHKVIGCFFYLPCEHYWEPSSYGFYYSVFEVLLYDNRCLRRVVRSIVLLHRLLRAVVSSVIMSTCLVRIMEQLHFGAW